MKIELTVEFYHDLSDIANFISRDKPIAARKFKNDLIKNLKSDLKHPFHFKKSIYFENNENYRDFVFKGYTVIVKINTNQESVSIIGILKYRNSF